jgi:hypothetical protein
MKQAMTLDIRTINIISKITPEMSKFPICAALIIPQKNAVKMTNPRVIIKAFCF